MMRTACPTKVPLVEEVALEKAIAPTMVVSSSEGAEENSIVLTTWALLAKWLVQGLEHVPETLEVSKRDRPSRQSTMVCLFLVLSHTCLATTNNHHRYWSCILQWCRRMSRQQR